MQKFIETHYEDWGTFGGPLTYYLNSARGTVVLPARETRRLNQFHSDTVTRAAVSPTETIPSLDRKFSTARMLVPFIGLAIIISLVAFEFFGLTGFLLLAPVTIVPFFIFPMWRWMGTKISNSTMSLETLELGRLYSLILRGKDSDFAFVPYISKDDPNLPSGRIAKWLDVSKPSETAESDRMASKLLGNLHSLQDMREGLGEDVWEKLGCGASMERAVDVLCDAERVRRAYNSGIVVRHRLRKSGDGDLPSEQELQQEVDAQRQSIIQEGINDTSEVVKKGMMML